MKILRYVARCIRLGLALGLVTSAVPFAQQQPPCPYAPTPATSPVCHPYPQPRLQASSVKTEGNTTTVVTGDSIFPKPAIDPFTKPPGSNFLPTIYTNMFDGNGKEMPNTLPSTPTRPYNLHDGDPIVSAINPTSPTDDLRQIFDLVTRLARQKPQETTDVDALRKAIQFGLDIVEGNPVANRVYSGLPCCTILGRRR